MAGQKTLLSLLGAQRYQVFTGAGFAGNPTRVHEVAEPAGEDVLLAHSQTLETVDNAYFWCTHAPGHVQLRFFSHTGEILVCGHALLATAHHLKEVSGQSELQLYSPCFRHRSVWRDQRLWVSLPRYIFERVHLPLLQEQLERAGLQVRETLLLPYQVMAAIVESEQALRALRYEEIDWQALSVLTPGALVVSCARADGGYALRYFSPWYGKPEDSATGSAQSYLAAYWLREGKQVTVQQLSPAGTAQMRVALEADCVWLNGNVLSSKG